MSTTLTASLRLPENAFVGDAGQLQRAVFFRAEALPLVFKDVVTRPLLFPLSGLRLLDADNFAFALEVKIYGPVINPVRPVLGQHLAGVDAVGISAHLDNLTFFDGDAAAPRSERLLGVGDGVL